MNVVGSRNLTGNNVEVGFQTNAGHTNWIRNPLLIIHRIFLWNNVQNLVARRQYQLEHIADQPVDIPAADFGMIRIPGKDAAVLQALDVLPGDTHVHHLEGLPGSTLRHVHRFSNGLNSLFNIRHYAAQYALGGDFAKAQYLNFAMLIPTARDGTDFCCPDIERNNDFRFVYIGLTHGYHLTVVFVFKITYARPPGHHRQH